MDLTEIEAHKHPHYISKCVRPAKTHQQTPMYMCLGVLGLFLNATRWAQQLCLLVRFRQQVRLAGKGHKLSNRDIYKAGALVDPYLVV
jgi:hypothetical protein